MTGPETLAKVLEEHSPYTSKRLSGSFQACKECGDPFPCLTRRLAETVRDFITAGEAMAHPSMFGSNSRGETHIGWQQGEGTSDSKLQALR